MSGGAASSRKGSRYERELRERFSNAGWGCIRLGGSGSGSTADLPDILAGRPTDNGYTEAVAVELKSGKQPTLYVGSDEVDALIRFSRSFGARPLLGARFTTQGSGTETWLLPPDAARGPTDGGACGLPQSDIAERATWVVTDEGVRRL